MQDRGMDRHGIAASSALISGLRAKGRPCKLNTGYLRFVQDAMRDMPLTIRPMSYVRCLLPLRTSRHLKGTYSGAVRVNCMVSLIRNALMEYGYFVAREF